ncbi:MAG: 30S ribosomal protein S5 [Mycoplasma sp.]|nr:30S ribosomal protein S5 [Mycoplasma sp.]
MIEEKELEKDEQKEEEILEKTTTDLDKTKTKENGKSRPQNANFKDKKAFFARRETEFEEKIIQIKRVTVVSKEGRRFSFSALVVIGNKKGLVGYGLGKANEVPDAIKKAVVDANKNLQKVTMIQNRTVPHEQKAKFLSSIVILKPAPKGKGIIASSAVRAIVELAGYKDIYTKALGSRNKSNVVKACLKALRNMHTIEEVAALRDKKVEDLRY